MSSEKSLEQQDVDWCVSEAKRLLGVAESIADAHSLTFNFDVSYGIGGRYVGGAKASCEAVKGVQQ